MMKQQASPEQILAAMSFEEKLSQLRIVWKPKDEDSQHLARTGAGALFGPQMRRRPMSSKGLPWRKAPTASRS
ncbi:hypothetical protein [Paenarthrobacter ilicis]|uniref:hypothetical protein n=1 Tax=Paenarthrobacter ilicis TaxID=43665 RepID=UPI00386F186B